MKPQRPRAPKNKTVLFFAKMRTATTRSDFQQEAGLPQSDDFYD